MGEAGAWPCGHGEMAELIRRHDWARTPLGPLSSWPASLKVLVGTVVAAPCPMVLLWGPQLIQIYNDGYRQLIGAKHPGGLGQPNAECWPELWEFAAPIYERVQRGESLTFVDQRLVLARHGDLEEAFFTLAYGPVPDEGGGVAGVLVTVVETTEKIRAESGRAESERRLQGVLSGSELSSDFRALFEASPTPLLVVTPPELTIIAVNEAYLGTTGTTRDEVLGASVFEIFPDNPADPGADGVRNLRASFERVMATGRPDAIPVQRYDVRDRRDPQGGFQERWWSSRNSPVLGPEGEVVAIIHQAEDITEILGFGDRRGAKTPLGWDEQEVIRRLRQTNAVLAQGGAALRESQARLSAALAAGQLGVFEWNLRDGSVNLDARSREIFDFGPDEGMRARELFDRVHPADRERVRTEGLSARRAQSRLELEYRLLLPGEVMRTIVSSSTVLPGAEGEPERMVGVFKDVTERRLAEEVLQVAGARQAFLVKLGDTLRALSDPIEMQAAACRVLGEQLRASRVGYFEVRGECYCVARDYTRGVRSVTGNLPMASFGPELLATLRRGETAWVRDVEAEPGLTAAERARFAEIQARAYVGVPLVKEGVLVAGLAVHSAEPREWTADELSLVEETAERTWEALERARAEQALRASEERFRTLFETMDEGFCVAEVLFEAGGRATDYRFLERNPAFEKHTGLQGVVGRTARELAPDLDEFWFETYGRVAATGEPARFESHAAALGGRWFDVSAFRLGAAEERKVAILFTDVTDRKQAEQDRERLVQELKEQDRRKDEFLATLAHELRNPLAPLRNGLHLLKALGSPNPGAARSIEMMERQLAQMVHLIDDLMDLSRISRGQIELRRERLQLADALQQALEMSRPHLEAKGQELTLDLPATPIYLDGDRTRLAQVVANLLNNAAKYTPRGGHVWLSARRHGDEVTISVRDNGVGIAPEMLPKVFDMFAQVDRSLEKTQGGLGIGLSLVKRLVQLHGGTVEVHSAGIGQGTEFTVCLPVVLEAFLTARSGAEVEHAPTSSSPNGSSRRILVVDDNRDAAETLAEILSVHGDELRTAYDGLEALEVGARFQPDVVLLDIGMPRMNGYEAAQAMRREPWGQAATLIALTGWGQPQDRQRSQEAGFNHHLVKPVEPEALLKLLS